MRGSIIAVAVFFLLLLLVLFARGWFGGEFLQGIDGNYGWRQMVQASLQDGSTGWWNPYVWLGMGQGSGFNTVFLFPRLFSMRWELLIGYSTMILMGLGFMYLFLRRLSLDRWGALFGAVAYGLSPHFITLIHPAHWDAVHSVGLIAALFYFLQAGLDGRTTGWRAWICLPVAGLFWGLLMNAEVQRGLYISVMAAGYALLLIARQPRSNWGPGIGKVALAVVMLLATFAWNAKIQFGGELVAGSAIATAEEVGDTDAERWAFATSWSFHPKELIDSLAPGFHGFLSGDPEKPYWGSRPVAHSYDSLSFFAVVFGLAGIWLGFRHSPVVRFFSAAALLSFLLACGEYWPGRPLFALWYQLPMMDKMRAPVKFLCVTSFAIAVLSAFGFSNLLQAAYDENRKALRRWVGLFSGIALFGVGLYLFVTANAGDLSAAIAAKVGHPALVEAAYRTARSATGWTILLSLLSAGAVALTIKLGKPALLAPAGLILLAFSLLSLNGFYINRTWFDPETYYRADPAITFLKQERPANARVSASFHIFHQGRPIPLPLMAEHGLFVTHLSLFHEIPLMENTPQSRIADDYRNLFRALLPRFPEANTAEKLVDQLIEGNLRFWRATAVRYIITDGFLYGVGVQPMPVFERIQAHPEMILRHTGELRGRRHAIFEVRNSVPIFQLAQASQAVSDMDAMLAALAAPDFNPRVALMIDPPVVSGQGRLEVLLKRPSLVRLQTETDAAATLLWNSRYSPDWHASINGVPASLQPANYMMSALSLPAGTHEIELRFQPDSPLRMLSLLAVLLGGVLFPVALTVTLRNRS